MTKYFIKPIGTSEPGDGWDDTKPAPCDPNNPDNEQDFVCFAKPPTAVRVGDKLIFYAVGNRRKIIGIYEVMSGLTSDAYPPPYNERWSYAVKVKMLSEAFSRNWAANSVTLDDIVRDYVKTSQANVTLKRRNLNCLSYGHDKVQVTEEFAEFLIGKIM